MTRTRKAFRNRCENRLIGALTRRDSALRSLTWWDRAQRRARGIEQALEVSQRVVSAVAGAIKADYDVVGAGGRSWLDEMSGPSISVAGSVCFSDSFGRMITRTRGKDESSALLRSLRSPCADWIMIQSYAASSVVAAAHKRSRTVVVDADPRWPEELRDAWALDAIARATHGIDERRMYAKRRLREGWHSVAIPGLGNPGAVLLSMKLVCVHDSRDDALNRILAGLVVDSVRARASRPDEWPISSDLVG